jgi:putative nucleotidyltransferase with HDIG domain
MRLDSDADDYFDRVADLVAGDPTFAARLLRYSNSAYISAPYAVTSIRDALSLVGSKGAVELVLAHSAMRIFLPRHDWERNLWNHSIAVGCLMRNLATVVARELPVRPEEAQTFGLLHDIGRFVLYLEAPESLRAIDETDWETPAALVEAEISICGFTHAELGYLALQKWKLPPELALAVRHHHFRAGELSGISPHFRPLVRLLREADIIAVRVARTNADWLAIPEADLRAFVDKPSEDSVLVPSDALVKAIRLGLVNAVRMRDALGLTSPGVAH